MGTYRFFLLLIATSFFLTTDAKLPVTTDVDGVDERKSLVESKHADDNDCRNYDYCLNHWDYCQTDDALEEICESECSFFETCDLTTSSTYQDCTYFDSSYHGIAGREYCTKISPFKLGRGAFGLLMMLMIVSLGMLIALIVICVKKCKTCNQKRKATAPSACSAASPYLYPYYDGHNARQEPSVHLVTRYAVIDREGNRQHLVGHGVLPSYTDVAGTHSSQQQASAPPVYGTHNNHQQVPAPPVYVSALEQNIPPVTSHVP